MNQRARDDETRQAGMHARHRFGHVVPSIEADDELAWLYNRCAIAVGAPSVQGELLLERRPGSPEAVLARAEAIHAARKICERLRKIGVREQTVLEALYTERRWPRALERKLHHLTGVVEALPGVRAEHLAEREQRRSGATTTTAWLQELVERSPEAVVARREEAVRACERALFAYEEVRGDGESVAPQEDRG
jgi:hypothetical protein